MVSATVTAPRPPRRPGTTARARTGRAARPHGEPGEQHRPPGGVDRVHRGVLDAPPGPQAAAVAGDDEQGVVDPDAEADQHPQDRGEADDGEDVAEQAGDGVADADRDQGGHDRGDRREQRAERQAEHDQGEDDPEGGAVGGLLGLRRSRWPGRRARPSGRAPGGLGGTDHRADRAGGRSWAWASKLTVAKAIVPSRLTWPAPSGRRGWPRRRRGAAGTLASIASTAVRAGPDVTDPGLASTTIWSASPDAAGKSCWRMARACVEGLLGRLYSWRR